jgi:DNA replication protein DnaC
MNEIEQKRFEIYKKNLPPVERMLMEVDKRTAKFIKDNMDKFNPIEHLFESRYIWGPAGTGKTVYAAWLMFEWMRLKYLDGRPKKHLLFVPVPKLLEDLKQEFNKSGEEKEVILPELLFADLLVLDDIGAIRTTDWTYQTLYYIIDGRYKAMRPTIYTSNLSLQELAGSLNDDRIPSRIEHECTDSILHFKNNKRNNKLGFYKNS